MLLTAPGLAVVLAAPLFTLAALAATPRRPLALARKRPVDPGRRAGSFMARPGQG